MARKVDLGWDRVEGLVCRVVEKIISNGWGESVCQEHFDFSSLVIIGGSAGLVLLVWVILRLKDALKSSYKNDDIIARSDPPHYPTPRTSRSWSDVTGLTTVLSRVQAYRKDTPPPPYEDPPSYQLAVQIELQDKEDQERPSYLTRYQERDKETQGYQGETEHILEYHEKEEQTSQNEDVPGLKEEPGPCCFQRVVNDS